ncbi:37440_t:CDS:2 [Gigaspora margarita]|uniref:37440_t:CDS:1 n=1 Tax=Gigaspora margarita TaxID=4874 RepID=A0ABN7V543_GIGMA|nr:37440_t:CDS:2 [Gigaspora margarita]
MTISSQRIRIQHVYQIPLFEPLLHHVSFFALNKLCDEWIKLSNTISDFPLKLLANQALQKVDLHAYWWIQDHRLEFLEPICFVNNDHNDHTNLQPLLQSLAQRYQFWLPYQQDTIHSQLEELVNTPPIVIENPVTRKL